MGLPVVDHHRQIPLPREGKLGMKKPLLRLLMAVVPVVVQADLADGAALWVGQQGRDLLQALVVEGVKLFRMDAGGKEDPVLPLGKRSRLSAALRVTAGIQHTADPALSQPFEQLVPVFVKRLIIQMRMGIKIHLCLLCRVLPTPSRALPGRQ